MRPDLLAMEIAQTIRTAVHPLALRVASLEAAGGAVAAQLLALETREGPSGPPGPPGPPGPAGRDGTDGKDGAAGLRYLGVHVPHRTYDPGDLVTAAGSAWYCGRTTTGTPGHSTDWQLMVKRGRDARGRD